MRLFAGLLTLLLIGAAVSLRPPSPSARAQVFERYWELARPAHTPLLPWWDRYRVWLPSVGSLALAGVAGSLAVRRR